jgi:hypothetical protein
MKMNLRLAAVGGALMVAAFFGGCAAYRPLQIAPVAAKAALVVPKFSSSYYYYDRDQTLYFVMRSHTTDKATRKAVDQIATVRVFWRPVGGKTSMDPTSLNATYRYVLMTPDSIGMYEGAGFVRLWGKNGAGKIDARLVDGDLRLTQASANFVDTLGRSRIRGNFSAKYDDVKALDMLMDAHREFFARSLHSLPASPSTAPAEGQNKNPVAEPPG